MTKFEHFIDSVAALSTVTTKEYFDRSTYYGEVDQDSQRRHGKGIFVCIQGDIYFGIWRSNLLG
jgi:hypothetical protein